MKKIACVVMTIYSSFVFMFWMFISYCIFIGVILIHGKKKDREFLKFFYRFVGAAVAKMTFLKVEKRVHYQFDENESYVVVSNHVGAMDIPANVNGCPKEILFKFLGKKEADKLPFFGFIINRLCILVDRKNIASRKSSYTRMKEEMENGYSIFVYPEGTRNRTEAPIKSFYDGAFRLAIEMQKPIVVNTLVGMKTLNPPTGFFTYFPGSIVSNWDSPILTKGMTEEDIPELKKRVGDVMINRLQEK